MVACALRINEVSTTDRELILPGIMAILFVSAVGYIQNTKLPAKTTNPLLGQGLRGRISRGYDTHDPLNTLHVLSYSVIQDDI